MADEFTSRKPKNSCDLNDRWNVPERANNADTSFGTSNLDIFARPNPNFTDLFQKEIPICWDRASARFGTAVLLAEKSPLTPKSRPVLMCSVVPLLDDPSIWRLLISGFGTLFLLSRHIRSSKEDGTEFKFGNPRSEYHHSLHEVSFYLPEQGIIKFKVLVDKEGKITPALNEARQFLDKRVDANQPNSPDFVIESSAENLNQFVLKSGSIELGVNLKFVQDTSEPAADGSVTYTNQRVILAKSQPLNPLKIGDEKERARFSAQKRPVPVSMLQRQTTDLPRVKQTASYPDERTVEYLTSPGKIHRIMLSDGNMAVLYIMDSDKEPPPSPSLLYIPDHQTGEMRSVELRDTGKGFVAEGYSHGFKVEKAGSRTPFTLVDRKTIEPEKIDLQKELETLEAEAKDGSFSRENQFINKFRRAVIATFIGNEHLLSGSDLLAQMKRKPGETLDLWRVRVLRALTTFSERTNEFKLSGNGFTTADAPKKFYDAELNPPKPKPGEPAPKPNLCDLLRTRISDSDLEKRINEIPEPRTQITERKGEATPTEPKRQPSVLTPGELRDLLEPPTPKEKAALASLLDRGPSETAQPAAAAAQPMSIPEVPSAPTSISPSTEPEAVQKLVSQFNPIFHLQPPLRVTAFSKFEEGDRVAEVNIQHLGMNITDEGTQHLFRLSVESGPTIYIAVKKSEAGGSKFYTPLTALIDGKEADQFDKLKKSEQYRLVIKSGEITVTIDPRSLTQSTKGASAPAHLRLVTLSGFTPRTSVVPPQSSPNEPMSIDPSLTLQPQTSFADYGVREEAVEKVARKFGIAIESIWDLDASAHRGMSLDQITQSGNHFAYQRAGSRLQIEFDRSSANPHFADVANLKITYDRQPIPFEYTVEQGRPYLLLKGGLQGVVFYLSPTDQANYAITEATHPVIREQAERDGGYIASPRPGNIPYPKIRENFLSLPSDQQTPDEQILAEQIYRNRLGNLREAGVLPESLKEQTLIAKRLGVNAENFDRRDVATFSLLHKLEEIAGNEKLKKPIKEALQQLAVASDDQKVQEALSSLQSLEKEIHAEQSPPAAPPLVCEAPVPGDQKLPVSKEPPPTLLIRALESLGEPGQKLIRAFFPSSTDQAAESNPPTFEAVKDAFFGIANFFGITDAQLTDLLSPDSTDKPMAETAQPSPEPLCREPDRDLQSVPLTTSDGTPATEAFDEKQFMGELNQILNQEKSFALRLAAAISYTKASGSQEIQDWLLAIETSISDTKERQGVLWSFFDSLRRYPEATTPIEKKVFSAMRKLIRDTDKRQKAVELLRESVEKREQERKTEEKRKLNEFMDKP